MKRILKKVFVCALALVLCVAMLGTTAIDANAATKKKKKAKKEVAQDETMVMLSQYLDVLIAIGAPAEDILNAQKAVMDRQAYLDMLAANAESVAKSVGVIFVGDSRTVQMHGAVPITAASFIAENSKGYEWFKEEAIPRIDNQVTNGSKIVINLGVNDPGNIDKYIDLVNAKTFEWTQKGATVYYATVNPVTENPYTSNDQVNYFNDKLVQGLIGVNIIDTNAYLKMTGYTLVDGLHFTDETYQNLYGYILSRL